jgi:hypothetical protein
MLLIAALACSGTDPVDSTPATDGPTWYADVEPLVYEKCSACHNAQGVGTGDLTDPGVAVSYASTMKVWVEQGEMPLPVSDPTCRTYVGHERMNLTEDEVALIGAWADAGAPLGDEADRAQGLEVPLVQLQDTDVTIPMIREHELDLAEDGNEYYCQVVDNPFTETTYITGIDVDLGVPEVVHHMILAIDQGGNAGIEYGTDGDTDEFQCRTPVVESDWLLVHAWTPGMEPVEFAEGQGFRVEPGQQLVLQMHYFGDPANPPTDLSAYKLRTTDTVDRPVEMAAIGPTGFTIPAGDNSFTAADGLRNSYGVDFEILGAFPHMHLLGSHFSSWINKADDSEDCLLDGRYDFDHQMTYMFEEPALLADGERLRFECTWDNSSDNPEQYNDPPQDVHYGEGTTEEMCFLLFYYSTL